MYLGRVKNDSVWQSLKILYMGALLILLINILFGFDNSLTVGEIDRWQMLIHLHSASVGWITLSAIGIAIWICQAYIPEGAKILYILGSSSKLSLCTVVIMATKIP